MPVALASAGLPHVAYLIDPRFRGGTSTSFRAEISAVSGTARISVHARSVSFLGGQSVPGEFETDLENRGIDIHWDEPVVAGDLVVVHNPIFLGVASATPQKLVARDIVVVTHENFLRPGGADGFDFEGILKDLDANSVALRKWLAPVSAWNRETVLRARRRLGSGWRVAPEDWSNVIDFPLRPPTPRPRDRRGRLSRSGLEKFPPIADMDLMFPAHAETNVLMGADYLTAGERLRPHWDLLPFGALPLDAFFDRIDFMVYATSATWSESYGRVIAEGIAAGKVVIAGPEAARVFGDGVVVAGPAEVDRVIAGFLSDPVAYSVQVRRAQEMLAEWSPDRFRERIHPLLSGNAA